jgi:hypothetical protein
MYKITPAGSLSSSQPDGRRKRRKRTEQDGNTDRYTSSDRNWKTKRTLNWTGKDRNTNICSVRKKKKRTEKDRTRWKHRHVF